MPKNYEFKFWKFKNDDYTGRFFMQNVLGLVVETVKCLKVAPILIFGVTQKRIHIPVLILTWIESS